MASKTTAQNLLAAAFGSIGHSDFQEARKVLERADREVRRLVEEGCDDPPKKERKIGLPEKLNPLAAWKKRQQARHDEAVAEPEWGAHLKEEERKTGKMKKALFVLALPVLGALTAQYGTDYLPEFDKASRGEFQAVAACNSCETLTPGSAAEATLCGQCGGTEFQDTVAAQLTQDVLWWSKTVGWQLPNGKTLLSDPEASFEVPPLKVKGKAQLTRF